MSSAGLAALISIVGLSSGTSPGTLVWAGTPAGLGPARAVPGAASPVLSPNGRLVAYVVRGELRVQPVGGGATRTLTQVPGLQPAIAFSPSGMQIAFAAEGAVILLPVAGKGPVRRIVLPAAWARSTLAALAFSPDGRWLAFSRTSGNGKTGTLHNELDVIGVDGQNARTLAVNPAPYAARAEPSWSPASTRIAFKLDEFRLATVSVTGGPRVPLTKPARGVVDSDPTWSPDDQWIAFARSPSRGVSDVWLARPNGTGLRRLTTTPIPPQGVARVGSTPLAWSPDSTQLLAFRHDRFAVVNVATRASRTLKRVGIQYALLDARWV
jgi:dipeptidyl aminopeptidase/acylaminoacyl peptidase